MTQTRSRHAMGRARQRSLEWLTSNRCASGFLRRRRQRGAISMAMIFLMLLALTFAAISVDIGHVYLVRYELQSAADAAALTGAGSLLPGNPTPNWSTAQTSALRAVSLNNSDGETLSTASIQTGFWNLAGSPAGMQASTITPQTYDAPAVQVTVSRATGLNGGPVSFFFAPLFGVKRGPVSATAVAVASAPGTIAPGGLFPVAIGQCIYSQYWNAQTGAPTIDPATGSAYTVQIGNGASYSGCEAGQWTSFQTDANDVPTVRGLIQNGNPTTLSIGDSIWIQDGVKATLYSSVPSNTDVLVPVVSQVASGNATIVAFAAFHIDFPFCCGDKDNKYIQGHFITGYKVSTGSGQAGPYYGAYTPPRLAQ